MMDSNLVSKSRWMWKLEPEKTRNFVKYMDGFTGKTNIPITEL